MTDRIGCVVIGAGVIGLAIARAVAQRAVETVLLEAEPAFGQGVSARHSEVIHAGLYSPPGWRKTVACVRGRRQLVAYAAQRGIAHRRLGKLVVANGGAEDAQLESLMLRARANGVEGLQWLTAAQARAMEPELRCSAALFSAESGVIDSHALMLSLLGDAQAAGAAIVFRTPFESAEPLAGGWRVRTGGPEPTELQADWLVNAAGLQAQAVAARIQGGAPARIPALHRAKGNYFKLRGRVPFQRLIYPVPAPGGLGVHLTLDLQGQGRFGPDVEWVDAIDHHVDPRRGDVFYDAVRRYWPGLPDNTLVPDYSGIRPKLSGPGEPARDFEIDTPAGHGRPGLVQLFGIESPGLTAALALADEVAAWVA